MQYFIDDLINKHNLSKTFIYQCLKTPDIIFSEEYIKNKRIFNDQDLYIFNYIKKNWEREYKKTVLWMDIWKQSQNSSQTIFNNREVSQNSFWNEQKSPQNSSETVLKNDTDIEKIIDEKFKKIKDDYEWKIRDLNVEILNKEKIITIKEENLQKYGLLYVEEKKEKELWLKKYEETNKEWESKLELSNDEKNKWVGKYYSMKSFGIISIFLALALICVLAYIIFYFNLKIN